MTVRWLFGDQLGAHFTDDHEGPFLLVESRNVFQRRRFHRAKAHLVLSAIRHRVAELRSLGHTVHHVQAGTYLEALDQVPGQLEVIHPTSYAARRLVSRIGHQRELSMLSPRGFVTEPDVFTAWAASRGNKRLLMDDFYRDARRRHGVLMDGAEPSGGKWNFDHDNREPPPKGADRLALPEPWWPAEDAIDDEVRVQLDRWASEGVGFLGSDGPRKFAATAQEAQTALDHFLATRIDAFGLYEDAVLGQDSWMAHSLVSAPLNLGLLDPLDVVTRAEQSYRDGARLASVEGFVRQVMGWRDYVWHLYWYLGEDYRHRNALAAHSELPEWFAELDHLATDAACLKQTLADVAKYGWTHHIPRLMILGSYALQRGWKPEQVTDWFHRAFVDGYDWVMVPNVMGMALHADGGVMATKPYTSGGAYLSKMTDHCSNCVFTPTARVGEKACPFTSGYWAFLHDHRDELAGNHRMRQPLAGLNRLANLDEVVAQSAALGSQAPTWPLAEGRSAR